MRLRLIALGRVAISGELSGEDRDRTLAWLQPDAAAALLKQGPEVY